MDAAIAAIRRDPRNKGKLVGQNDLGIDSKLRGCDLMKLRVRDVCDGDRVAPRAIVLQQKAQRPVQFEITPSTRDALEA